MNKRRLLATAVVMVLGQLPVQRPLPASEECLISLPLQNPRAITIGETFYLPKAAGGASCSAQVQWKLIQAPDGSSNLVYNQGSEHPRFTPDLPGIYQFASEDGGTLIEMKALRRTHAERFRNHYLTPLYGATQVGADIWTANGASYSVSRVHQNADGQLNKTNEIEAGSWPAAVIGSELLPYVLVAQRGADSVGFVDRTRNVLIDALWVGDEPSGLALSPDAKTLYVSLATERAIAVVDLTTRTLKPRIKVGFDPRALALSADGATLYAASYRSANLENGPGGGSRPVEDDKDIFVVDTQSGQMVRAIHSISADLRAMVLSPEGDRLYVAATDGQTLPSQADPTAKPFMHQVAALAVAVNAEGKPESLQLADLTRQEGSQGPFVNPSGIAVQGDQVWVSAESSDQLMILDRVSLAEKKRVTVGSGPRQIVVLKDAVAVHCHQSFELYIVNFDGSVRQVIQLSEDPRPAAVALGERVFVRPGRTYAANHSCSSCHVEAQNDAMIWRFGANIWHNVRPLQLLAATTPLEWGAYASNADSFGFMGPTSIINRPPTNAEAEGLAAFLKSLIGAPRATGRTRLDGSFSELGLQGKAIFEGKGRCVTCHSGVLYTNRKLVPKGKSGEPADVPSLLGAYRQGMFFVKGQSRSIEDAVDVATNFVGVMVTPEEKAALVSFINELTPKGSHPLGIFPDIDTPDMIPATVHPTVAFADSVDDTRPDISARELAKQFVTLSDASGAIVTADVKISGGEIELMPLKALSPGERYTFRAKAGLPFRDGGVLEGDRVSSFTVARPATAALPTELVLKVLLPASGPPTVPPTVKEMPLPLKITGQDANSLLALLDLGGGKQQKLRLYQDADLVRLQQFALPRVGGPGGGTTLADASEVVGALLVNAENPAIFNKAQGTLTIGSPGSKVPHVTWILEAAPAIR